MSSDLSARADALGFQVRSAPLVDFQFRADDGAASWTFEGVACTVDHPYSVRDWLGEYTETIAEGAFKRTLSDPQARLSLHLNHQYGKAIPFATRDAGTLEAVADPHLRISAELDPSRPDVQSLRSAVRRREMREMSIGFSVPKGGDVWSADYTQRTVTDMRLREVSIVEEGANDLTTASIRTLAQELQRFNSSNIDEAEVRRAIQWLNGLLGEQSERSETQVTPSPAVVAEATGLVVTDDFIAALARRHRVADLGAKRYVGVYNSELRGRLQLALNEKYPTVDNQYLWIRDFHDTEVVFELEGFGVPDGIWRIAYQMNDQGSIILGVEAQRVTEQTTYAPAS